MQFTVIMLKRKILGKNVQLKKKKERKNRSKSVRDNSSFTHLTQYLHNSRCTILNETRAENTKITEKLYLLWSKFLIPNNKVFCSSRNFLIFRGASTLFPINSSCVKKVLYQISHPHLWLKSVFVEMILRPFLSFFPS